MPNKKVQIDKDTARYFLRVEAAFNKMCRDLKLDSDKYIEEEGWQREMFRDDLFDAWTERVAKKPYRPQRQPAGYSSDVTRQLLRKKNG